MPPTGPEPATGPLPGGLTDETRWRCSRCGNLTRFDVTRTTRVREFVHVELSGAPVVEETEVLGETVEQVRCRWCDAVGSVEVVPRPSRGEPTSDPAEEPGSGTG